MDSTVTLFHDDIVSLLLLLLFIVVVIAVIAFDVLAKVQVHWLCLAPSEKLWLTLGG